MKTSASFKLSRSVKCFLSSISNKQQRAEVRKLFIDAEHTKSIMANRRIREKISSATQ